MDALTSNPGAKTKKKKAEKNVDRQKERGNIRSIPFLSVLSWSRKDIKGDQNLSLVPRAFGLIE